MQRSAILAVLVACSGPEPGRDPTTTTTTTPVPSPAPSPAPTVPAPVAITAGPEVVRPESPEVRLVQLLTVSTDRPTRAEVELSGGGGRRRISFSELATDHELPLLGLVAGEPHEVSVTLVPEEGEPVTAGPIAFDVVVPGLLVPVVEVLTPDTGAAEPGYTLLNVFSDDTDLDLLLAVDLQGRLVWLFDLGGHAKAISLGDDGWLGGVFGQSLQRLDPVGDWGAPLQHPEGLAFHHEASLQADGSFVSLVKIGREVTDYPIDDDDLTVTADVTISDERVVHIAADGTVLADHSLADRLDERRVGYGSTWAKDSGAYDWGHANAALLLPDDDSLLVSLRNQDALVKLDRVTGDLRWILGNHDGWPPELQHALLQPVGDPFAWPYHQHAPMVQGDRILVFDNGNQGRTTPYSQDPESTLYSRLVIYEVDQTARTVRQAWEHLVGDPPLYSAALGNADWMSTTGNVLATFSFLTVEDGVANLGTGKGERSIRVVEVEPASHATAWDIRLYGLEEEVPMGWQCDRATRVPSLYGTRATEVWLED